jgi:hypothetical protein
LSLLGEHGYELDNDSDHIVMLHVARGNAR